MSRNSEPLYTTSLMLSFLGFQPYEAALVWQRKMVDVKKGMRNNVSGQADCCKAVEACPLSEEGKRVSHILLLILIVDGAAT